MLEVSIVTAVWWGLEGCGGAEKGQLTPRVTDNIARPNKKILELKTTCTFY